MMDMDAPCRLRKRGERGRIGSPGQGDYPRRCREVETILDLTPQPR
jgi:hypothetical protein